MCNRFVPPPTLGTIDDEIRQLGLALAFPAGRPNLPPEYAIGDSPPVVLRPGAGVGAGLSLAPMTWAWKGPGGKPVFNFRSDGRAFGSSERCLIPAAGFFEFTDAEPGHKRKTKWRFDLVDAPWMWMAGVVRQGAFAILTTGPGPDVAPYHDRQVCVLAPGRGARSRPGGSGCRSGRRRGSGPAAQGGRRGMTPLIRRPVSGFATDRS